MCNVFYRYSPSMIPQSSQIILMLVVPGKCHEFPDAFFFIQMSYNDKSN